MIDESRHQMAISPMKDFAHPVHRDNNISLWTVAVFDEHEKIKSSIIFRLHATAIKGMKNQIL